MRIARNAGGSAMNHSTHGFSSRRLQKAILALVLALAGLWALAGAAQAASAHWKLLAVTGPTNLPPEQSEVQRITVGEAEGGTFTLSLPGGKGEGTPVTGEGHLTYAAGSTEATIVDGSFDVGEKVQGSGIKGGLPGTIVEACSPDCSTPGSTLTLSQATTLEKTNQKVTIYLKELQSVTGTFHVGDELSGSFLQEGTVVTEVGAGTLKLSKSPFLGLAMELTATETTAPIPYNAPSEEVQTALEALALVGPGAVSVIGGPGGGAEHPYFLDYGGALANTDVLQPSGDASELVGEHAYVHAFTVVPGGAGTGVIAVAPANVGGASTFGPVTIEVGPLPPGIVFSSDVSSEGWTCSGIAGMSSATCTSSLAMRGINAANSVRLPVEIRSGSPLSSEVSISISGGSATGDTYRLPINVSNDKAPFGAQVFWASQFDEDGNVYLQAGGHPYSAMSYIELNTIRDARGDIVPSADSKDVYVDLSPGFVGNPMITPRCPQWLVTPRSGTPESTCGEEMNVGGFQPILSSVGSANRSFFAPIYNDVPPRGYAAEFTTKLVFPVQSLLASVRNESDYGVRITGPNNPNYFKIFGSFAALEGYPQGSHGKPFLTNATDCANERERPPHVYAKADTWSDPGNFYGQEAQLQPVTGCENLQFRPGFSFQPTSSNGSSPVGATAHLHIGQEGLLSAAQLAPPHLKKAVVKLPEGISLNPSAANGLQACSEDEIGYRGSDFEEPNPIRFNGEVPHCPDGSKLGTVEVDSPLLEDTMQGTLYLAKQYENPFGSLLGIYLVIDNERNGILIKLPGKIDIGAGGQLTATFDHNPQLPFEDLTLHFRGGGPHSELATPEVCGHYETKGSWEPWSAPESGPPAQTSDGFDVSANCSPSPGARPFNPSFEAGTTDPKAGGYAPLVIKVGRADGEQELRSLDFTMPPGFSGKLAGIPYCSDGEIATAQSKSGTDEQAHPSCPSDSRLGSVSASAGVGSDPFRVGGNLYLAGPYKGAPLSAVVITPALAGPFDLGNVVIRTPLDIDPETAQVSAASDPIPTSLEGIPLKVRQVQINLDRPDFTLNPTSCEAMQVTASIGSSDGATASPTNRFQVGGCRDLSFEPKTYLRLYGGTGRGAHPKLRAIYVTKPGEANLNMGAFTIPRSEFLDQAHIRTVCTRVQFAANNCPSGAIYGHVKAYSPIVGYPVQGPVYLRSSNHELPDLVFDLHGPSYQPVHVVVDLRIDSIKGQIRATAENAPDLPVSKLIFFQQGGKKGLLVNSRNICKRHYRATVQTEGHNGKRSTFKPVLSNSRCSKQRKAKRKHKGHHKRHNG